MTTHRAQSRGYTARWSASLAAAQEASARTGQHTPLDHAHLARYTLGDRALELEILDLFLNQAPQTLDSLRELAVIRPMDPKGWVAGCHTIKGSARAVGAVTLAEVSESGERELDLSPEHIERHLIAMAAALQDVAAYITVWRQNV